MVWSFRLNAGRTAISIETTYRFKLFQVVVIAAGGRNAPATAAPTKSRGECSPTKSPPDGWCLEMVGSGGATFRIHKGEDSGP